MKYIYMVSAAWCDRPRQGRQMMTNCVTIGNGRVKGKAKKYPYYQACEYEAVARKSDGKMTWRFLNTRAVARRSIRLAEQDAREYGAANGIPYLPGVRQNDPVAVAVEAAAV
jgi:hypothetical protein